MVADLIGFWALWHLEGGFEGVECFGYSQATIYRKVKRFRRVFGAHPEAPRNLNVALHEVGLQKTVENDGAGGASRTLTRRARVRGQFLVAPERGRVQAAVNDSRLPGIATS
jgi:hypothetical protein